jgi:hypothetical protein
MNAPIILENDWLRCALDDSGVVRELVNKRTGSALVSEGDGLTGWKMISNVLTWREHPLFDTDNHARVTADAAKAVLVFDGVQGAREKQAFHVTMRWELDGPELRASIEVDNRDSEILREIWFPFISGVRELDRSDDHHLLINYSTGLIMDDPLENLPHYDGVNFGNRPGGRFFTRGFGKYPLLYPGVCSMPWLDYYNGRQGWYMGYHDMQTPSIGLLMRTRDQHRDMQLGFVRYPMIQPGQHWKSGEFVIRAHDGGWHAGARRYADFAKDKIGTTRAPDWLQNSPGFHIISCIGQDRRINNDYDHIYKTFAEDKAIGLDLPILVFGWVRRGFDNGYPELDPDERIGGAAKLRSVIARVKDEGGRVILYTQGRLIDMCTDFFKEVGSRCCVRSEDGTPYIDEYSFNTEATLYPNRQFALSCPSTKLWEEQLKKQIDIVMELGADGLLYDQIGADNAFICFDKTHMHSAPDMAFHGKIQMLENLQRYTHEKDPAFAIIGELICDAFLQKLDITHGWETQDGPDTPPYMHVRSEIYRYVFPDHRPSCRMAGTVDAYSNAFVNGMALEHAHRRQGGEAVADHCDQLQKLRAKLMPFFNDSRFVDDDGLICQPADVLAKHYVGSNGSHGVALANTSGSAMTARLTIDAPARSARLYWQDGTEERVSVDGAFTLTAPPHTAAFLLLEA